MFGSEVYATIKAVIAPARRQRVSSSVVQDRFDPAQPKQELGRGERAVQLFLTDETNLQPSADAKFFVYGGLIVPVERLVQLDHGIQGIRAAQGYRPEDELKFDTRSRPQHVEIGQATEAKRLVVELSLSLDCKFIVHVILHDIIRNQQPDQRVQRAADYVLGRFNYYLSQIGDYGLCIVDNLPVTAQFRYLAERFSLGLDIQGERRVRLDRITLFAATCANASHVHSAIDVILGSFRYCINNPRNVEVARAMMLQVVKMMWHRYDPASDTYHVGSRGMIVRPPMDQVRVNAYREEYESLQEQMNALLKEADAVGEQQTV
ncbi:MAG: hypothetical protein LAO07_05830 [Acidobacteriia bacterium]|nr:hypothetical protein [Terriglobia bacterium]